MPFITTQDGTQIFYKDWGPKDAQPIVFHHGWPLSADDWDNQMMFFLGEGYRVIAHDRRGHGRSSQTDAGNEMDTYVADVERAGRQRSTSRTRSTSAIRRVAAKSPVMSPAREPGRVAKAVLLDAVPPVMVKKDSNPGGTPIEVFDGFRAALGDNRAQLYLDIPTGPFYDFNRTGRCADRRAHPQLVAAGHDGQRQGRLRMHQGVLRNRLHRGSEDDRRAGAGHPQRRRPDRALCGLRAAQRSNCSRTAGSRPTRTCRTGAMRPIPI